MKQKIMMPNYMENFRCIAGECEETCCAGWYIAIDEGTYKRYKKVKHPEMKKRLDKELVVKKGSTAECAAKIKLKNNRCAFLGKDNLCDIYKVLGEQYLSETCQMYPRNTNQLGERLELSLALSCPEAARQILLNKAGMTFKEQEYEKLPVVGAKLKLQTNAPKQFEDYILKMRALLISIWQEESYSMQDKWQVFEYAMFQFDTFKGRRDFKKLDSFLKEMQDKVHLQQASKKEHKKRLLESYTNLEMAKKLLNQLREMRSQKKWPSTRYEVCYNSMLEGFGDIFNEAQYEKGQVIYKKALEEEHPYILENYFVNYIYERLVPINQKTPLESLKEIYMYFALIRLHLMGQAGAKGRLEETDIITVIQSFTRVFDHNALYMQQIKKQIDI